MPIRRYVIILWKCFEQQIIVIGCRINFRFDVHFVHFVRSSSADVPQMSKSPIWTLLNDIAACHRQQQRNLQFPGCVRPILMACYRAPFDIA